MAGTGLDQGKSSGKRPWSREIHQNMVLWMRSAEWRHRVLKKQVSLEKAWRNQSQEGSFGFRGQRLLSGILRNAVSSVLAFPYREGAVPCTLADIWLHTGLSLTLNPKANYCSVEAPLIFLLLFLFWKYWMNMLDKNQLIIWRKCLLAVCVWWGKGSLLWTARNIEGKEHSWTDLFRKLQSEKQRTDFQTRFPLWKNILRHRY